MSADDFQDKYASVMEGMLKSAVAETRKLFETMVDELKAEINKIKQENEELKTKCNQFEMAKGDATAKRDSAVQCVVAHSSQSSQNQEQQSHREELQDVLQKAQHCETHGQGRPEMTFVIIKEDVGTVPTVVGMEAFSGLEVGTSASGIQLEGPLVSQTCSTEAQTLPQKASVAHGISSLSNDGMLSCLDGAERRASEPEHRMVLSFVTINNGTEEEPKHGQEGMDIWIDKDLVMFEEQPLVIAQQQSVLEPTEKRKTSVASLLHRGQGETALNKQAKVPLQQPAGVTSADEQLSAAPLGSGAEPEQPMVISLAAENNMEQQPIYSPNTFVILTQGQGQVVTFEEQPMVIALQQSVVEPPENPQPPLVTQQSPKECETYIIEQSGITVQQPSGVPSTDKPLSEVVQLENGASAGITNETTEVEAISQPDVPVRRKRGRPPKKRRQVKGRQAPEKTITDVPTHQNVVPSVVVEVVGASSAADRVKATASEFPKAPLVQVPEVLPLNLSIQKAANTHLGKVENVRVSSFPASTTSFNIRHSSEKGKKSDSQQPVMGMEADIQVPTTIVSPDIKTHSAPAETHSRAISFQPRSRHTSVTLQDAMLLVEAMNTHNLAPQPMVENSVPTIKTPTTPQIQSSQSACESPEQLNVPVAPQASDSKRLPQAPAGSYEAVSGLPTMEPSTQSHSSIKSIRGPRKSTVIPLTRKNPPRIKVITPEPQHTVSPSNTAGSQTTPSTAPIQTNVQSHQQHLIHPRTPTGPGPDKRKSSTVSQKIIVVPKMASFSPHTFGSLPPTQASAHSKVVNAPKHNLLPTPTAAVTPPRSTFCPSVAQKTAVSSTKSLPVGASQTSATSANQHSEAVQPKKVTVIIPRRQASLLQREVVRRKHELAAATLALTQAHSGASSQQLKNSAEAQTASDEAAPGLPQARDSTSDTSEPATQSNSLSAKTNEPPETFSNVEPSPGLMQALVSPRLTPAAEMKNSAVVRLCRLPPTAPTKESGEDAGAVSNASTEIESASNDSVLTTEETWSSVVKSTQTTPINTKEEVLPPEMPTFSTDAHPDLKETSEDVHVRASQMTTEPHSVQEKPSLAVKLTNTASAVPAEVLPDRKTTSSSEKCTVEEEESVDGNVKPFTRSAVSVPAAVDLTERLAASAKNTDEVQDCALPKTQRLKEKPPATVLKLTSVASKDTCDPHLKMTKTQFLAQLSVSPVVQDPKKGRSKDFADASAATKLQRESLVARLRSHVKSHFLGKRAEANQNAQPIPPETPPTSHKRLRLENYSDAEITFGEDPVLAGDEESALAEDDAVLKSTSDESNSISPRSDSIVLNLSADENSSDAETFEEPVFAGKEESAAAEDVAVLQTTRNDSTSISPRSDSIILSLAADDPEKTGSVLPGTSRTSAALDVECAKKPLDAGSLSVSPTIHSAVDDEVSENHESTIGSYRKSRSMKDYASPQNVGSITVSPERSNSASDGTNPEKRESLSVSPMTHSAADEVGVENPESTLESCTKSPSMKDSANPQNVATVTVSPGRSASPSDGTNPEKKEYVSSSPTMHSAIDDFGAENPESTIESCLKSPSMKASANPQNVGTVAVSPGRSSSASDGTNPEKRECVSGSPTAHSAKDDDDAENPESTIESFTKSRSVRDCASPQNVGSITVSPEKSSSARDGTNPEKSRSLSVSPMTHSTVDDDDYYDDVGAENPESTESCRKSRSTRRGTKPQNVGSITVSPGRSSSASDGTNPKKKGVSVNPSRSSLGGDQNSPKKTKSTVVTPRKPTTTNGSKLKKTRSIPVGPGKASSSRDDINSKRAGSPPLSSRKSSSAQGCTDLKMAVSASVSSPRSSSSRDSTNLKKTGSTSVSPGRRYSGRDVNNPKKTASSSVSPRRSAVNKDGSVAKQTKSEQISGRRRRFTGATESSSAKKPRSESGSPIKRLTKNGIAPKNTGEPSPEKLSVIHNGAGPKKSSRVVNAKRLTEAAKAKTTAKAKKSNGAKVQNETEELETEDFGTEKKSKSKAQPTPQRRILISPRLLMKSNWLSSPHRHQKIKPKVRLPVIYPPAGSVLPVTDKTSPVTPSPPFSVIGRHLLKNQCGECGRVLSSQSALESHISVHTGRRPFLCKLCEKSFPDAKGLKRHGGVHRNGKMHTCPKCGKGFVYHFGLTKHLQMVHSRIKPFVCQICSRGFFARRDVEAHIRIHTGEKPFHCNLCEKKFTRRVELNVHLMWHNGEKRHWCQFCGKGFLDYNNMKRHRYIHTGEKPYACPHCTKHFKQSGHLKKHVKNVHKID